MQAEPADFDTIVAEAQRHRRDGKPAEAAEAYRRALALRPDFAEMHNNLGAVLLELGQADEAQAELERAVALKPDLFLAHTTLANLFATRGDTRRARSHFDRAVMAGPNFAPARYGLGVLLGGQGQLDAAREQFEQVVALRPDHAAAYYNLGWIAQSQGNLQRAQKNYEQAIAIAPNYADAHNNLGNVLRAQGRLDEAVTRFERAVQLDPKQFHALNNLGCIAQERHDLKQAMERFRQALAIAPNYADAHNNLANVLQGLDRREEATAHYERAVKLEPNSAEAHNNLGTVLADFGRIDEARACFEKALALRPDYVEAHYHRAELKRFTPEDPDLAALRQLARGMRLRPEKERLYLHFALGKALEDAGDYERSMKHYVRGNTLQRRRVRYNEPLHARKRRRAAEIFDAGLLERLAGAGDPSTAPIFIVGMPRSGSTLVEQILASHPDVYAAGELPNLDRLLRSQPDATGQEIPFPEYVPQLDAETLSRLGQAYVASLPAEAQGKARVTDKMPANYLHIGLIRLILPGAKIVHTVRNPVDTCLSCFSRLFGTNQPFSYDLGELGRHYRMYQDLMNHWRKVLPPEAILDVEYEALVNDFEAQARRLLAFCGLEWNDRCLEFHRTQRTVVTWSNVQVRQPLYRNSLGRGQRYGALLNPLLEALGLPTVSDPQPTP
ncbi:MAG TPA: tetratricopeptide repeat protein [Pirellulales bacterium]|nr:tetratricopeptide repeat protein [Pirellulales bacterium]